MQQPQPDKAFLRDVLALAALVALLHVPDFFRTIDDYNEGLYAVVARELMHGHLPYVTAWEAKPPLFFAAIALFMRIFGANFFAVHLLDVTAQIATVLGVYAVGRSFGERDGFIARGAAILTAALMLSDNGPAVEGELLGTAFAAGAFALIARARSTPASAAACGALIGLVVCMKVSLLPIAAVAFVAALLVQRAPSNAALAVGALVPFAASALPYAIIGRLDLLLDANLWTVVRRFGVPPTHPSLAAVARQQLEAFFPAWLALPFVPAALRRARGPERRTALLVLGWLGAAAIAAISIREFFAYQFLVLMPPCALLAAWGIVRGWQSPNARRALAPLAALAIVLHAGGRLLLLGQPDDFARVAAYLQTLPAADRGRLYVASNPGIYVLADAPLPTRYALPQFLYARDMQRAAGVDGYRELERIFAVPPLVVVAPASIDAKTPAADYLRRQLSGQYREGFASGRERVYLRMRLLSRSSSRA